MNEELNAYNDLMEFLEKGEKVEAVVFGRGWLIAGHIDQAVPFVPQDKQGVVLTLKEAQPYFKGWSFDGSYGREKCPAVYVWTNKRVIWVRTYDGSTSLDAAPRNPVTCEPEMSGG